MLRTLPIFTVARLFSVVFIVALLLVIAVHSVSGTSTQWDFRTLSTMAVQAVTVGGVMSWCLITRQSVWERLRGYSFFKKYDLKGSWSGYSTSNYQFEGSERVTPNLYRFNLSWTVEQTLWGYSVRTRREGENTDGISIDSVILLDQGAPNGCVFMFLFKTTDHDAVAPDRGHWYGGVRCHKSVNGTTLSGEYFTNQNSTDDVPVAGQFSLTRVE